MSAPPNLVSAAVKAVTNVAAMAASAVAAPAAPVAPAPAPAPAPVPVPAAAPAPAAPVPALAPAVVKPRRKIIIKDENEEAAPPAPAPVPAPVPVEPQAPAPVPVEPQAPAPEAPVPAPTAPQAPLPPPATATKTRKKRIVIKNEKEPSKLIDFYKARLKDPLHYTYSEQGDLQIQGAKGKNDEIIRLKSHTALRPEERKELEDKRLEKLQELEVKYEEILNELRETVASYKLGASTAAGVVAVNEKLRDITLLRSKEAYPERWIKNEVNPDINTILLALTYERRKMTYDIGLLKRSDISRENVWGRYREDAIASTDQAEGQAGGGINDVFFIEDQENPFHPAFMREFVYEETRYVSPYQAYQAERFKELEMPDIKAQILKTRSARTIHNIAEKEPTDVKYPKELWEQILEAFYTQHADVGTRLKDTGSKRFHLSEAMYGDQNYLDALLAVRVALREQNADTQKEVGEVKESVITEEQQAKAKAGAIANFRRR